MRLPWRARRHGYPVDVEARSVASSGEFSHSSRTAYNLHTAALSLSLSLSLSLAQEREIKKRSLSDACTYFNNYIVPVLHSNSATLQAPSDPDAYALFGWTSFKR